jgi:hypothetical protein
MKFALLAALAATSLALAVAPAAADCRHWNGRVCRDFAAELVGAGPEWRPSDPPPGPPCRC